MKAKRDTLNEKEVQKRLGALSGWEVDAKHLRITKTFEFSTFIAGLAFVARVAVYAEVLGHHPNIELTYGKVKIRLTTHSVKGLTRKDFELAEKIDNINIKRA